MHEQFVFWKTGETLEGFGSIWGHQPRLQVPPVPALHSHDGTASHCENAQYSMQPVFVCRRIVAQSQLISTPQTPPYQRVRKQQSNMRTPFDLDQHPVRKGWWATPCHTTQWDNSATGEMRRPTSAIKPKEITLPAENYEEIHDVVRAERLELSRLAALEPKSSASTNSATLALSGQ